MKEKLQKKMKEKLQLTRDAVEMGDYDGAIIRLIQSIEALETIVLEDMVKDPEDAPDGAPEDAPDAPEDAPDGAPEDAPDAPEDAPDAPDGAQ